MTTLATPNAYKESAVLSAPPPQASVDALTPIYPTPRFSPEDKAEKFTAPPASAPIPHDEVPSR